MIEKKKPVIHDLDQLQPDYARYRQWMCETRPDLADRLVQGKMAWQESFLQVASQYEVILLDAFGVIVVGKEAIAGAVESVAALQGMAKKVRLVSNNASQSPVQLQESYGRLGFRFALEDIITSGMTIQGYVAGSSLRDEPYVLIGTEESRLWYAPDSGRLALQPEGVEDRGYLLVCSNRDYYGDGAMQEAVERLLGQGEPVVLLANPDLVAPEGEGRFNPVAGYTVARWLDRYPVKVVGLGKPFSPIFQLALQGLSEVEPGKVLMVGDTLDTDILGGINMGFATCLTGSGSYWGLDSKAVENLCWKKGIYPDYCVKSIGSL
ncbi:MAG: TIGR01459 family HAD-type hydrolase [Magnetococcales bacterium]|nr:TIGR01459 family HAD-type hydrolase [Magnetococcales bacterium]NGZ26351.1 TIGR01459 family HAD-type hydrolase [Magnetococcales bacterium]